MQRWQRFTEESAPWEKRFAGEMRGLFDRQQASILAHVAGRGLRQLDPSNPFDRALDSSSGRRCAPSCGMWRRQAARWR